MFLQDNISYETQQEFGIGYDPESNRITIPIYSEINDLIGVKGRLFQNHIEPWEQKYIYLEPCTKSKVLYGLNKTYPFIKRLGKVYIFESEKATMQAWSMGFYNTVSIGGKKISQTQIDKLTRLGVDLIFAFDKDVNKPELEDIADKFIDKINIYCIIDDKHILQEKESPTDKEENWQNLITKCIYKIK
jgi:DNA primase